MFGGPCPSWQVALLLTSPPLDAAAPDVNVPLPVALSGASPSLHAQHKEQRFLFLLVTFKWLHSWHGNNKTRRVADCGSGMSLREAKKEIGWVVVGLACKLRHKDQPIPISRAYMHDPCR